MMNLVLVALMLQTSDEHDPRILSQSDKDKISISAASKEEIISFNQPVGGSRSSGSAAPDPCSDPTSVEFSEGYCGGLLMCRGDGVVGELVLIEHERRHYADNADIYAQQVATMNYCAEQSESADDEGPSLADLIAREWDELQRSEEHTSELQSR